MMHCWCFPLVVVLFMAVHHYHVFCAHGQNKNAYSVKDGHDGHTSQSVFDAQDYETIAFRSGPSPRHSWVKKHASTSTRAIR